MGNIFTPVSGAATNMQLPNAVTPADNTRVTFDVGKYFNKVNKIKKPTPQSVNRQPSNFPSNKTFNIDSVMTAIGLQESGGKYGAKGSLIRKGAHAGTRALGKYQFMPKTLANLGFDVSERQFLRDTKLQEQAMRRLTFDNAKRLGIKNLNALNATQARALAMAHYAGVGKARKFLNQGLSSTHLKTQRTTGSAFPSMMAYSDSVFQHMQKLGSISKAQIVLNKLINKKGD